MNRRFTLNWNSENTFHFVKLALQSVYYYYHHHHHQHHYYWSWTFFGLHWNVSLDPPLWTRQRPVSRMKASPMTDCPTDERDYSHLVRQRLSLGLGPSPCRPEYTAACHQVKMQDWKLTHWKRRLGKWLTAKASKISKVTFYFPIRNLKWIVYKERYCLRIHVRAAALFGRRSDFLGRILYRIVSMIKILSFEF